MPTPLYSFILKVHCTFILNVHCRCRPVFEKNIWFYHILPVSLNFLYIPAIYQLIHEFSSIFFILIWYLHDLKAKDTAFHIFSFFSNGFSTHSNVHLAKFSFFTLYLLYRCCYSNFKQEQDVSKHDKLHYFSPSVVKGLQKINVCILLSKEHLLLVEVNVFNPDTFFWILGNGCSAFV